MTGKKSIKQYENSNKNLHAVSRPKKLNKFYNFFLTLQVYKWEIQKVKLKTCVKNVARVNSLT